MGTRTMYNTGDELFLLGEQFASYTGARYLRRTADGRLLVVAAYARGQWTERTVAPRFVRPSFGTLRLPRYAEVRA